MKTQNKKFGLVVFFLIFLPLFLAYLNFYKASLTNFEWGYDHADGIGSAALVIAIVGCFIILKQNSQSATKNGPWRITALTLLIIFSVYLLLGYLFDFGF